jgi:hypothetical protein
MFGMDPMTFLTTTDRWKRSVMQAVAWAGETMQRDEESARAEEIKRSMKG